MKRSTTFEQKGEIEYKFILLGDTSVGKTCLFKKITTGTFIDRNVSTVGIDRRTVQILCDIDEGNGIIKTRNIKVNLTDTAGQERFKAITKSYYKGSDAALLLYDITDKRTFEHIQEWVESIRSSLSRTDNKYSIFLIGTKIDLVECGKRKREIEIEEAKSKCKEFNMIWGGESSNKNLTDVQYKEIFKDFIKIIYSKIGFKKVVTQNTVKLASKIVPKKKNNNSDCLCLIY